MVNSINKNTMKYLFIILGFLILSSCEKESFSFEVSNPSKYNRFDEPVFIDFDKLPKNIELGLYSIYSGDTEVPFQLIDKDGDGRKDHLFLLVNIKGNETLTFEFNSKKKAHDFKKRANVRFGSKKPPYKEIKSFKRVLATDSIKASDLFLMEGPAWENDEVAFRNYYDQRNGIDIFGKQTEEMVLDSVGIEGTNYHELADWGMDILKVGNSLGAGAIALQVKDTIYPIRNLVNSNYELIEDGPLYASFKLIHKDFEAAGREYDIEHLISIYGGAFYYTSSVSVSRLKGDEKLITGIVNLHSDKLYKESKENEKIFATYDMQAEDKKMLGMAIVLDKDDFISQVNDSFPTKGIENTYMISLKIKNNTPTDYRFYSAWETGFSSFRNLSYFSTFVERDADKKSNPLGIKIVK